MQADATGRVFPWDSFDLITFKALMTLSWFRLYINGRRVVFTNADRLDLRIIYSVLILIQLLLFLEAFEVISVLVFRILLALLATAMHSRVTTFMFRQDAYYISLATWGRHTAAFLWLSTTPRSVCANLLITEAICRLDTVARNSHVTCTQHAHVPCASLFNLGDTTAWDRKLFRAQLALSWLLAV